jgi:hypothetical protein
MESGFSGFSHMVYRTAIKATPKATQITIPIRFFEIRDVCRNFAGVLFLLYRKSSPLVTVNFSNWITSAVKLVASISSMTYKNTENTKGK